MQKAQKIENLLKKKFFISQSSNIYGGVAGFFDYGPLGCSLRNNIVNYWRSVFTNEPNIYEVDSSVILPEAVLKASGHVDKFCDTLIFDEVNGECFRADHYLRDKVDEETGERLDVMSLEEINETIAKFDVKSPSGNKLGNATHFNLMFKTFIGPKSQNLGYLRPETAQGQFLNYKKVYELNNEKFPFGTFSIGKVFRNEISPRGGLLRVREFEQAELEFFVHSDEKTHAKYDRVKDVELTLHFGSEVQETKRMRLCDAIDNNIIKNRCIGYFVGLTHNFLKAVGFVDFRFRQHKRDEMAHYACDCWDAEILTTYGYIECVGIADRSCYDLSMHSKCSGASLVAQKRLDRPRQEVKLEPMCDMKEWGKTFKDKLPLLLEKIKNLKVEENNLVKEMEFDGQMISLEYKRTEHTVHVEDFVPSVIEPSFGIGRIFYSLIEQVYWERKDDEQRHVLSLSPVVAPYQVGLTSLRIGDYKKQLNDIFEQLKLRNIRVFMNERNVSIGRRYASSDEIGVPYFITFDNESVRDEMVTIRERDSMDQVRVLTEKVVEVIDGLVRGSIDFDKINK
ncbi:glycine-tRNA ligase [Vavraia culicis subsp. floridensis]|uniref:glycine--tRNA ligase n=1 Tax=Vavraia culicis (isolate floridensis) TaxID=948595 RepID=L2GTS2_VAVCU|nr:glycine-tRNA ligase [Vavraia culicis subsp. floridensis]ELA46703.1 glycine-tRNA ligase [Vavraia culicis subsp. floridensis]